MLSALASLLTGADQAPHWLAWLDTSVAAWSTRNGALAVYGLAAVEFLVGVAALPRMTRTWALAVALLARSGKAGTARLATDTSAAPQGGS